MSKQYPFFNFNSAIYKQNHSKSMIFVAIDQVLTCFLINFKVIVVIIYPVRAYTYLMQTYR